MPYYAIVEGRNPGVYDSDSDWKRESIGYKHAVFKRFDSQIDALKYVTKGGKIENVFVDGSCRRDNSRRPAAGFGVYYGPGDASNTAMMLHSYIRATNVRAELCAVLHALKNVHQSLLNETATRPVRILSDSKTSVQSCNKWGNKWKKNGWKKSRGGTIRDVDLIKQVVTLKDLINSHYASKGWHNIIVAHVNAHSGNLANNEADRLASLGAAQAEIRILRKYNIGYPVMSTRLKDLKLL